MAETRAQAQLKNTAARETDGAISSRLEALEKAIAVQNERSTRTDESVHEMIEAFKLMTNNNPMNASTNGNHAAEQFHYPRQGYPSTYNAMTRLAKVDFPRFNGEDVKEWLFKVEEFFGIDNTPMELRVRLASIHFDRMAAAWHQSLAQSEQDAYVIEDWDQYKVLLKERFEDVLDDPIAELKRLQETAGISDYHAKFELIRTRVKLSESYLVSAYLAGLNTDTQMHIRMFQPKSVRECLLLGRLYETAHPRKTSQSWKSNNNSNTTKGLLPKPYEAKKTDTEVKAKEVMGQPKKFLSQEEMNDRRSKGLCYYCDEKYTPGHYLKHKKTQLYTMEVDENEEFFEAEDGDAKEDNEGDVAHISVSAVAGITENYRTMKVRGVHNKKILYILIDSGSTHNFMDPEIAKKLNCNVQPPKMKRVAVADGGKLTVSGRVDQFQWTFQNANFQQDMMIIPLGNCDMVLGVQWLSLLGPITWDFQELKMQFRYLEKRVVLHGIKDMCVKEVKAGKMRLREDSANISMIFIQSTEEEKEIPEIYTLSTGSEKQSCPGLEDLLQKYECLFDEPKDLPPQRVGHDHKIPLLEGSNPVNQRPYRYALYQKTEIDKMVQSLLDAGTIQSSSSPYASPVVLVKKKDNSWRLCVDYRNLNSMTIKDRFPIPLIEDLMDELGGSSVYSKIDLRAGYHQVRMHSEDIHKTAFKTHSGHYEYLVMPFGLTNAPATFQNLMNTVFKPFLRKFVLIFFDDILIYSASVEEHVQHLSQVFEVMRQNNLYAKKSKCDFATTRVEYLGHFIEAKGVSTDPNKIKAVKEWPQPTGLKQLRGFSGLAGYYRKFVKGFGGIARPLTVLTKKDSFCWHVEAQTAFDELKTALCEAPVLALPDFNKQFVVETDACGSGIGAVLMQEGHPIAYISRHLKGKQAHLSIYEKELLAVVFAVQKWRHYLLHGHFIIRTDQRSLKYLLEQRLNTPIQQQWLPKLLEFDYEIQYRQGKDNLAADALSRVEGSEVLSMALSVLECDLMKEIQRCYTEDELLLEIIEALKKKSDAKKHFTWRQETLRRKGKLVIPAVVELRRKILEWLHGSSRSGHSGRDATHQRVKSLFYWKGMSKDIQSYIRSCSVCQQCKYETVASPGLEQPLPIPTAIWTDISMDFIDGLPKSFGKSVIFVVVDRLSKAAHFMALSHPYTAASVAQAFLDTVYRLHGLPQSIVSDRDTIFLSDFWRELFTLQGVSLNYSSAYHPQSDGQTEVVNRCLESYLRCMTSERPHLWSKWLPLAEYWYNTTFHTATQITPFEAVYGRPPPVHLPYLPGESKVEVVAKSLQEREDMLLLLQFHLLRAQHRMKQNADLHRTERSFEIGDYVYVKLQPYRQQSTVMRSNNKLAPKFYGPYKILDRCGAVAYKLELPPTSLIHPVFHVSQLKVLVGNVHTTQQLPMVISDVLQKQPEKVLERKMVQRQGRAVTKVLIKWIGLGEEEATWEFLFDLQKKFPDFEP